MKVCFKEPLGFFEENPILGSGQIFPLPLLPLCHLSLQSLRLLIRDDFFEGKLSISQESCSKGVILTEVGFVVDETDNIGS